jgi:hypothetical protein
MFKSEKAKKICPLLKKPCIEHECAWYVQVRGYHPQSGDPVDHWDCSIVWQPILMIENSQQQRQTGAAVESFRNEMVKANEQSQQILIEAARQQNIIEHKGK